MGIVGRSVLIAGLSTKSDSDERIPGQFSEHWHIPRRPSKVTGGNPKP